MSKSRIAESDASALASGRAPENREELAPLADSLARYRVATWREAPSPSEELSLRLDMRILADLTGTTSGVATTWIAEESVAPSRGRARTALAWIAGLGIVTKVVLGIGVAAVAATGAGAAGVLPGDAQRVFDTVLPGLSPQHPSEIADERTPDPTEHDGAPTSVPSEAPTEAPFDDPSAPGNSESGNGGVGNGNGNGNDGNNGNPDPGNGNNGNGVDGGKPEDTPGGNPNK